MKKSNACYTNLTFHTAGQCWVIAGRAAAYSPHPTWVPIQVLADALMTQLPANMPARAVEDSTGAHGGRCSQVGDPEEAPASQILVSHWPSSSHCGYLGSEKKRMENQSLLHPPYSL